MRTKRRGMTLVEIMVVIVILVMLATAVTVGALHQLEKARVSTAKTDLRALLTVLDLYKVQHGRYPPSGTELASLKDEIGRAAVRDPWHHAYLYELRGGTAIVKSFGADGEPGGGGFEADLSSERLDEEAEPAVF